MTVQPAEEQQLLPPQPDGGDPAQHRHPHFDRGRGHGPRAGPGARQDTGSAGGARHDRSLHPAGRAGERGDLRGQHGDVKGADRLVEIEKREKLDAEVVVSSWTRGSTYRLTWSGFGS